MAGKPRRTGVDGSHIRALKGGADTAVRDGTLLSRSLTAVQRDEAELPAVVAQYELRMIDYGFTAVTEGLHTPT
ncbi:hypothetical protein [Streptomyces roseochromogenus]|uniref:Uncharacterized protein n=1 Tax=Streptomyces roseochromogenus subsp. oscitans DS 12.976 TaxID=1352936 RepID=V6KRZ8_STRRC|nr:hypothetical protein [Streptomyces roseochromogenus]EST34788.1 hypothetical protein M878_08940 [Streptomyces roseochromogenus subsp. oscitans DS 12.976]